MIKQVFAALLMAGVTSAFAGELRLSNIDTNQPRCGYAHQEVSFLAANQGRLPIRLVCVNGPVYDPRGVEYAYQLQTFIPDTTPINVQIELGIVNTNDYQCQKAQKEFRLLNTPHLKLSHQCVYGPFRDEHTGQLYDYQLHTWLIRLP